MKKSLEHISKDKQDELQQIVFEIRKNCDDVEKIILFGSYARGDYQEGSDHISDYEILVVTQTKEVALNSILWRRITYACRKLNLSASIKIITHDIEALNIKLAEDQYFYSDIKKEGIIIFDSGKYELSEKRELTPIEKQKIAQEHFDYWFSRAAGFEASGEFNFNKQQEDNDLAAFCLHQAAESAYKAVLLVFSNYSSNDYFLEFLGNQAAQYNSLLENVFSKRSEDDENRFKLLEYAYIGGRYDPNYRIAKEDIEILTKDVKKLIDVSKEVCLEKIQSF